MKFEKQVQLFILIPIYVLLLLEVFMWSLFSRNDWSISSIIMTFVFGLIRIDQNLLLHERCFQVQS